MSKVWVGGFLCVYGEEPSEECLALPRDTVQKELRSGNIPLPLNINHNEKATIGMVRGLFDLEHGLFCVAQIQSQTFMDIIRNIASKSKLIAAGSVIEPLPPDPEIECLSSSFPGLSLSSKVLQDENLDGKPFFHHVSVCGVGRRPGTIAIFGREISWILDRFSCISESEKRQVLEGVNVYSQGFDENLFSADLYDLLADSLDTSYIRKRFPKLQLDKQLCGLSKCTYIKASEPPVEIIVATGKVAGDQVQLTTEPGSELAVETCDVSVVHGNYDAVESATATTAMSNQNLPNTTPLLSSPPFSDCVFLPKDAFFSLLNVTTGQQPKVVPPVSVHPPVTEQYQMLPYSESAAKIAEQESNRYHSPCQAMYPYWQYSPVPQYPAVLHGYRQPKTFKKRHFQSDSEDELSFPGDPEYTKKRRRHKVDNDDDKEMAREKNDLRELVDMIGMLRQEINALKHVRAQSPQRHVVPMETLPTIEEKGAASPKPSILNASLTPETVNRSLAGQNESMDLLKLNKKLFVDALNKMDS
ncbi:proteinase [Human betaherpesvirus 6B]|uniref:Capsid scaffolding protein n=3 Tax=Roseolovirus TaxID=40272 RepID=A0A1W6JFG5_9BETA|nr:capsid maturation protease [Human betaherpesvirus 6B]ARJ99185.1 U53 [Human betaherpesvirus 6]OPE45355.1 hypothetical protein BV508_29990 [Mycobacterium intermedium]APO37065.1 capsid maturation protease [Human betaherpesvirus 6B]APO37149.1 capsid maturation protease [Human betaherpesvirus 6B]